MSTAPPLFPDSEHLWGVFRGELERKAAERAVASGFITAAQLAQVLEEMEQDGRSLSAILLARGLIDRETLRSLVQGLAREGKDAAPAEAARVVELPIEVREAAADPMRNLAHFVLVTLLGRGGTSDVWKAWDRPLSRWVAVKIGVAALESASARERFEREATAVARLSHPNILPVHATSSDRGRPYLVMPFIDGQTLDQMKLPPLRALLVTRTVALALDHAHLHGVVHRDVKPRNIMIDRDGAIFVVDFGLVHLLEDAAAGLTRPGDVLGTAGFMSPEQARGGEESRLASTDVYGLGATLYHMVTGVAPFTGESFAGIVARIAEGSPPPPRQINPTLDRRIEIVIGRAMETDPRRRYPSMREFADDLGRLIDDEDIAARPASWMRKRLERFRKRRALPVVSVSLAILLLFFVVARWRIDQEKALAAAAVRDLARSTLDTALRLRRAGDIVGMRQVLPRLATAYEQLRGRAPDMAEVEYLMGRMHRALMNEEQAIAHQEKALTANPAFAPALYERAVLLSKQYGRALTRAQSQLKARAGGGDEGAVAPVPTLEAGPGLAPLRAAILRDCARIEAGGIGSVDAEAARGIVAHYRQRYDEARERLTKVVAQDPLKEEAWELLARTGEREARLPTIDPGERARRFLVAEAAYTQGLVHDRGYLPHLVGRCHLRQQLGFVAQDHPEVLARTRREYLAQATADAGSALTMDADNGPARACRAEALSAEAWEDQLHGRDARALLDAALADFDRAAPESLPDPAEFYAQRGRTRRRRAIVVARTGQDPLPDFAAAEADLGRSIALDAAGAEYWRSRASTRTKRGLFLATRTRDPVPDLTAAMADLTEAIRLDPKDALSWEARGYARARRALSRFERGEGAVDQEFDLAERDFARALELFAREVWMYIGRGQLRTWRGRIRIATGADPLPDWKGAEEDFARALTVDATIADPWLGRAQLRIERATYLQKQKPPLQRQQPLVKVRTPDLPAAAGDLNQGARLDPGNPEIWAAQGDLAAARGDFRAALAAYRKTLALNPALDLWLARRIADAERRVRS